MRRSTVGSRSWAAIRRPSLSTTAVAAACAGLLGACQDRLPTVASAPDAPAATLSGAAAEPAELAPIREPAVVPRFVLALDVTGPFQPGAPVRLSAAIQAPVATPQTTVRFIAPELALEQLQAAGRYRPGQVNALPALRTVSHAVAAGGQHVETASVVFPAPGYYQVGVVVENSATGREDRAQRVGRRRVLDQAVETRWVWVDENGGRVTPTYDPTVYPAGVIPQPGRRRLIAQAAIEAAASHDAAASGALSPLGAPAAVRRARTSAAAALQSGVQLVWNYADAGNGYNARPIPQAYYEVRRYGNATLVTSGYLGDDGSVTLPCMPNESPTGYFIVKLVFDKYDYGKVNPSDGGEAWVPGNGCDASGASASTGRPESARVWENLIRTVEGSRAFFGVFRRTHLTVQIGGGPDPSIALYYPNDDRVYLPSSSVYAENGSWTVAHEYGHAWNNKAAGPMYGVSGCDGSTPSLACAWVEGVATYHAIVARFPTDPANYEFQRTADNFYKQTYFYGTSPGTEGRSEDIVAAWLYDLTDDNSRESTTESFDQITLSSYFVAQSLQQCRFLNPSYNVTHRVDAFRACLEQAQPPQAYLWDGYRAAPMFYQVTPSKPYWDPTAFHTLWRNDLFLNP